MILSIKPQFDAIAKRIVDMSAGKARDVVRFRNRHSCGAQAIEQAGEIQTAQGGVRFFGGMKIRLDAEMNLHATALKPAAAAFGKFGRFGDFAHAEHATIKRSRLLLAARRNRKLDVIDGSERNRIRSSPVHACVT